MWLPVVVRHDESFLRFTERPLIDHLADRLNEVERSEGKIQNITIVDQEEDKWAEVLVNIDKETN